MSFHCTPMLYATKHARKINEFASHVAPSTDKNLKEHMKLNSALLSKGNHTQIIYAYINSIFLFSFLSCDNRNFYTTSYITRSYQNCRASYFNTF